MTRSIPTPGQTVGPFYGFALPYEGGNHLVPPGSPGSVLLHGHVYDGHGEPLPDALVEIWQADAEGTVVQRHGSLKRDGWTFTGWGRAATDRTGRYFFSTVVPGATDEGKAPFFAVVVFARGLLDRLFTRAYLPGPAAEADPFLTSLSAAERSTLIAQEEPGGYRFDIHLQGAHETVFLDY